VLAPQQGNMMTAYFGFTPSETLKNNIETAIQQSRAGASSSEPHYLMRDKVSLGITDELIDTMLVQLVHMLPESDKRDTMEKLCNFIKSTVHVLMKQLLSKETDEQVQKSTVFLEHSIHLKAGQFKVGATMPDDLISQMKASFAQVAAGNDEAVRGDLIIQLKSFSDHMIQHFMADFSQTLDLGMFKRKAEQMARGGITKALHVAINRLIPSLNPTELATFTAYYDALIYPAD
jgi:hypothetical protein